MALNKQPVSINFTQGVDTKADPYQVEVGKFLTLVNSVFTTTGRMTKRNGFSNITTLPTASATNITTLNDNLIATGTNLQAYSADTNQWLNKGIIQPVQLSTQSIVRTSTSQSSPDSTVASNGLICTAYMESSLGYYQIADSTTGQKIVSHVLLPSSGINPRVFLLGSYFIVTFIISGTPTLQFIAIPMASPTNPRAAATISAIVASQNAPYDGYVANNILFLSWEETTNTIGIASVSQSLAVSSVTTLTGSGASSISVTVDQINRMVWVSYWYSASGAPGNGFTTAFTYALVQVVAVTQMLTATYAYELITVASNKVLQVYNQVFNYYTYLDYGGVSIRSDYVNSVTVTAPATGTGVGTVGTPAVVLRSVGLASKPIVINGVTYFLVVYGDINQPEAIDDSNQPTYFLIDGTGNIYMRLAYSNGGGYASTFVLPTIQLYNNTYYVTYLYADFLTTVNKGTAIPAGNPGTAGNSPNAIYTQYGVNLATFTLNDSTQYTSEIATALHLTGGQLWEYDGVKPVEHGFHVWPENIIATTTTTGTSQTFYYQFTYEWTDGAGNLHRSAPSIPTSITTAAGTPANTINVPTLRLTYKTIPNPVRIVGYRWSTAQEVYYQFTSVTSPIINDPTVDSIAITDDNTDAEILGNAILYTTGGVVEDIAAPASIASALFDNRLWLIDAEDQNLLWFSKQVIESVPVEMSDLLTYYVAPTTSAQGSTGPLSAIYPMDDKLIMFKKDAAYYLNGTGPDNTGVNSQYSQPIFITAAVGCANPDSIVLTPNGLMFQSDKGIWLLGRDLSTNYIGAPVEIYNSQTVMSAKAIPGTTQVRFILNNSITLMYDYYFNQWATHTNIGAISSTIYQNVHTYLNQYNSVLQEVPNTYTDGSSPVLMSFTTSWINLAGIQGFERFYAANLLGTYYTPFKLNMQLAYNYNSSTSQSTIITPDNYAAPWGGESLWGSGGAWGGNSSESNSNVFTARLFPQIQKCSSFQVSMQEVYDPSYGVSPGEGLTLSGLLLLVGIKRGSRTQSANKSFG